MAANHRPFSCLQCLYRARTHPNMMSHIAIKHAAGRLPQGPRARCTWSSSSSHERTGDAAIIRSIKDEADLTEVAVHPRVPHAAAPLVAPAAPLVAAALVTAPLVAAPVAPLVAPPVAPAAPPANIDWALVPRYFLYFGIPYGTGRPIPGGR
ncbi:hypothetical protein KCU78_g8797, partial [Aureobasidium melanogenum]